jgi:hypothetical protein
MTTMTLAQRHPSFRSALLANHSMDQVDKTIAKADELLRFCTNRRRARSRGGRVVPNDRETLWSYHYKTFSQGLYGSAEIAWQKLFVLMAIERPGILVSKSRPFGRTLNDEVTSPTGLPGILISERYAEVRIADSGRHNVYVLRRETFRDANQTMDMGDVEQICVAEASTLSEAVECVLGLIRANAQSEKAQPLDAVA